MLSLFEPNLRLDIGYPEEVVDIPVPISSTILLLTSLPVLTTVPDANTPLILSNHLSLFLGS
jgi:hypothetical protein